MFDFSSFLNLPLIWACILGFAIFVYVCLDGFDLGVGILFPYASSKACQNKMMNSILPFWDGNETWIVMSVGVLLVAFPVAYGALLSALYVPIILLLIGLIFRGVSFEFRAHATPKIQHVWDMTFHFGSLLAAFAQGMFLGGVVQGIDIKDHTFAGTHWDFLTPFTILTGVSLIFGYALLGATWIVAKTDGPTRAFGREAAKYLSILVFFAWAIISFTTAHIDPKIEEFWFTMPHTLYLLIFPVAAVIFLLNILYGLKEEMDLRPFFAAIGLFATCFIALGLSMWPWIVPFEVTIEDAAADPHSLSLLLVAAVIVLPVILFYTGYSYYVFRHKAEEHHDHEQAY